MESCDAPSTDERGQVLARAVSNALLQSPADVPPWWGVPLIAGGFLLTGALIAFISTSVSDRRKLAREDRRQWDREIRDSYIEISDQVDLIVDYRYRGGEPDEYKRARYEVGRAALGVIRREVERLEIIGTDLVISRGHDLVDSCQTVVSLWHDKINPGKAEYRSVNGALGELRNAVKDGIRLERYKPFIRPPMSRRTRLRLFISRQKNAAVRQVRDVFARPRP